MLLEFLQNMLRIDARVGIVEPGDKAQRNSVVFRSVNPRSAVLVEGERITHGVDDFAGSHASRGKLPQFLDPDAVGLRIAVTVQLKAANQLFSQRAARALGKDDDLGFQIVPRLEIGFLLAILVDAFVVGANAGDAPRVEQQFRAGKAGEQGNSCLFHLAAQPLYELVNRDNVVAVVAHRRRRDGELELARAREVVNGFFDHLRIERPFSKPGRSSRMERGSSNAPERQCAPTSRAFSSR